MKAIRLSVASGLWNLANVLDWMEWTVSACADKVLGHDYHGSHVHLAVKNRDTI